MAWSDACLDFPPCSPLEADSALASPARPAPCAGRSANGPALRTPGLASRKGDGPCLTTLEVKHSVRDAAERPRPARRAGLVPRPFACAESSSWDTEAHGGGSAWQVDRVAGGPRPLHLAATGSGLLGWDLSARLERGA